MHAYIHTYIHTYIHIYIHVVAACSHLSSNLYLDARHNPIAKAVYDEITPKSKTYTREPHRIPEQITKTDNLEIWWTTKYQR